MITPQDIQQATMYIDGVDIYNVGALVESFKVSATAIANTAYQGVDSTDFNVLSTVRGMRMITVTLFYKATTRRELALKKTKIDNALGKGKINLDLPDGFSYWAYLTSAGEEQTMGVEGQDIIALCTYTLQGIRHGELKRVGSTQVLTSADLVFECESEAPLTDCRITVHSTAAQNSLTIGTVTITNVAYNDTVVVDGIEKRILQNGAPCAGNMSFVKFPKLTPGTNTLARSGYNTYVVEYYPIY